MVLSRCSEYLPNLVVYFSDLTPLVILIATFHGAGLLEVDGSHTHYSNPIKTDTSFLRIDLVYSTDEVLFQNLTKEIHKYVCIGIFNYVTYISMFELEYLIK